MQCFITLKRKIQTLEGDIQKKNIIIVKKYLMRSRFHTQSTCFENPLLLHNNYKNCHKLIGNNYAPFVNSYLDYNNRTKRNTHIRFTDNGNIVGLFSTYDTDVDQDDSDETGSVS